MASPLALISVSAWDRAASRFVILTISATAIRLSTSGMAATPTASSVIHEWTTILPWTRIIASSIAALTRHASRRPRIRGSSRWRCARCRTGTDVPAILPCMTGEAVSQQAGFTGGMRWATRLDFNQAAPTTFDLLRRVFRGIIRTRTRSTGTWSGNGNSQVRNFSPAPAYHRDYSDARRFTPVWQPAQLWHTAPTWQSAPAWHSAPSHSWSGGGHSGGGTYSGGGRANSGGGRASGGGFHR